jgi:hypothetical protein
MKSSCRARREHLERAAVHLRNGNASAANDCFQKAVDISPATANRLVQVSVERDTWEPRYSSTCRQLGNLARSHNHMTAGAEARGHRSCCCAL